MKEKKITFDGKIDELKTTSEELGDDFSIQAWVEMNKRDNFDIPIFYYTLKVPYWHPIGKYYHNAVVFVKRKEKVRYFNSLEVCKENWARILDIIFQPIKTWNKPAQHTLASAIWRKK